MAPTDPTMRIDDLVGIELFLDAVRLGSISAAARRHHLAQPSATERLRRLERRLGVQLLRRGPGGSAPTVEGEAVAEWARAVVRAVEQLGDGVGALRGSGHHDSLRIMASLTVAEYVLPGWLREHRASGGAPVELVVGNSAAVADEVAEGRVRLGFVETPRRFPGLRSAVVGGDVLTVVVAPGHPWARRRRPLAAAELAATPLLLRERGSGTRDAFESALATMRLQHVVPAAVLASTTTLKAAAAAGEGASVLSELAVAADVAAGTLVTVGVQDLDLSREFRAVWSPTTVDPDVQRFVRRVRSIGPR